VFVGIAEWEEKTTPARRPGGPQGERAQGDRSAAEREETPTVEIWHARDVDVMARQKVSATSDRRRSLLAAWHVESGRFAQLGREHTEQITPLRHRPLAYAETWTAYAMERSIGRPAADLSVVDLATGERTRLKDRVEDRYAQVSPGGRYVLYLQDDHYWTIDLSTRATANITSNVKTTFVDRESDATIRQKPPFGVAGWTKDDRAVVLYDKFDLWRVAPDGSGAAKLTDGAAEQIRHRYVRLDPDAEVIDFGEPVYLSLFGIWTKKSGYARLLPGGTTSPAGNEPPGGPRAEGGAAQALRYERLVWLDKSVAGLARAERADVFAYVVQAYDDSPDAFVGGAGLQDAKQITKTNPFHDRYAWGRAETIEYRSDRGQRLQGTLYYPAGYEPGRTYPMVVYMYERLSDGVHRWVSPSERESYNTTVFTSRGFAVLQPDIVFRPREPGLSVVECVGPAVRKAVQMGVADPKRVGIVGHSWGGFDTVFLATHTDLFAAAVAGAPITNLVSNYGNHHWSSGIAETDHIETGQQRMEVPIYEDLQAYIRNSAVFNIHNMNTPLLVAFGDDDGTVHWHQGVELYNIARRAKKNVVMLVYGGEDHSVRRKPNQLDYHRRIQEWFGHYLKGEPAPTWISEGVRFLDREKELKGRSGRS
jgi:dienelactone hydrolase